VRFTEFARQAPAAVDVGRVRDLWEAARDTYDPAAWVLPLPVWRLMPWEETGAEAWEALRSDLATADVARPMCVYLHVPFCASKCGFCDSYSFALRSHRAERIETYVERIRAEIALWSGYVATRPVPTVHLGGGTPSFLGEEGLARIVETCRRHLAVDEDTEWALESTARELTPTLLAALHRLGFRRLHVGVQSLEDGVRRAIGRTASADDVVATLAAARGLGWVVSVDMICGLPGQTLGGLADDLERLIAEGVDGVSLYELLVYPQNRRWAAAHGVDGEERHLPNFWTFLAAADLLERRGFRPNVFNHWAGMRDANTYFTFPERGEDLLALGPVADGVFGDHHYRHPAYAPWMAGKLPALEGGVRRPAAAERVQPVQTAILGAQLGEQVLATLDGLGGGPLAERWREAGLVEDDVAGGLGLTPSGSWFAGNMVREVETVGT
jgi:oxygen-independent coproporphyrinogen-3 oxidase